MSEKNSVVGCLAVLVIGAFCAFGGCAIRNTTTETVTATVSEKTVIRSGEKDKYLVFTDKEVFENTDELTAGKWNSSDVYARIKVGRTYNFVVRGWRVQFFSMYRNIMSVEEVR